MSRSKFLCILFSVFFVTSLLKAKQGPRVSFWANWSSNTPNSHIKSALLDLGVEFKVYEGVASSSELATFRQMLQISDVVIVSPYSSTKRPEYKNILIKFMESGGVLIDLPYGGYNTLEIAEFKATSYTSVNRISLESPNMDMKTLITILKEGL